MENQAFRILVVEDEGIISAGIVCCINGLGHKVCGTAYSGKEAITMALQKKPDLILMDINLPDMTGIEAMQNISAALSIPCIFLTGYSDRKLIIEANSIHTTYGYLIKPIDENELSAAIVVAMGRHSERREIEHSAKTAKKALEDRKLLERAKGLLMDNFHMKESEAMSFLQKKSNDSNKKLGVVAKEVVELFGTKNKG